MAFFTASFRSAALNHDTVINVLIPDGCTSEKSENIPTLYLLHGMYGNHESWFRKTNIERYANRYNIAVVCPDGENSFYNDMICGKKYFTYVSEELVDFTRRIFRLSHERENTYIAGLSMGGYGAFRVALMKPEQYAAAASLSGCLDIVTRLRNCPWDAEAKAIWGEDYLKNAENSNADLMWLVRNFPSDKPKPRLYVACGIQDELYGDNQTFKNFIADKGFEFKYEESDGVHNWDFWDKWIEPALDYMLGGKK